MPVSSPFKKVQLEVSSFLATTWTNTDVLLITFIFPPKTPCLDSSCHSFFSPGRYHWQTVLLERPQMFWNSQLLLNCKFIIPFFLERKGLKKRVFSGYSTFFALPCLISNLSPVRRWLLSRFNIHYTYSNRGFAIAIFRVKHSYSKRNT